MTDNQAFVNMTAIACITVVMLAILYLSYRLIKDC